MTKTQDQQSIATIRVVAADMVQKAKSGHPGAPMGCAPMAHVLFTRHLLANPSNPQWMNRDRFVLSNGHGCALQYVLLHLMGYDCSINDLQQFRQLGSKCPGHPEANHGLDGIEVTTGPLGQGIASAVGLAIAQSHLAGTFNKPGFPIFTNHTYVITGDGCLQEGISSEAASLAGHLGLGNLIMLYDDNCITIDGETDVSFTEDVMKRFESYGWHTLYVEGGDCDLDALDKAIEQAKSIIDKPSLIKIKTTIGFGSVHQGLEKVHGAPLGPDDIAQVKTKFGLDPTKSFDVPEAVYDFYAQTAKKGAAVEAEWNALFARYQKEFPELGAEITRRFSGELPLEKLLAALPKYSPNDAPVATRKLSENVLNKIADLLPELIGGSADLTASNLTRWKTAVDYQSPSNKHGSIDGRYIRYGVREHAMAGISNGLAAYGLLIPFASTFFNFISYALGAVRLSALSRFHVLYIMTHDSIGLGEDGPTHQPIETLASCRAIPNMLVFRPADGNETSGAYYQSLIRNKSPSILVLTRQNLPHLEGTSLEAVAKGAYVLVDKKDAQICLVASGSEVSLAVDASKELTKMGIKARVVSMPSFELFEEQTQQYKESVFVEGCPVLSIEAMSTFGWAKYAHASCGIDTFGASAPASKIYEKFELVPDMVAQKAQKVIEYYKVHTLDWRIKRCVL